jgi:hypothetical protein
MRIAYTILEGKPELRKSCGRLRYIYLKVGGCENEEWIHQAQDRDQWRAFLNRAMKFWLEKEIGGFHEELSDRQIIKDSSPRS